MNKITKIEQYIQDFFSSRYENYRMFYIDESRHRRVGIYNLNHGTDLMDLLNSIMGNIEEKYFVGKLVPGIFAKPENLIDSLLSFKEYLIEKQPLIDANTQDGNTNYVIIEIQTMKNEIIDMIDHVVMIWDQEDAIIPYVDLRQSLISEDLDEFLKLMNSILASVSYPILKTKEGYLHSNIHLILKLLGFDIISEENTNIGRIDAVIRFSQLIYIFEFKLGSATEGLEQIKEKKYYEKYIVEKKRIIMVGVGFSDENRNINDIEVEEHK